MREGVKIVGSAWATTLLVLLVLFLGWQLLT